jgi:hypothetical protein
MRIRSAACAPSPRFWWTHVGSKLGPCLARDRDLFEDVWLVARQAWYVRELTARFARHPAVVGWLLTNEVPIYGDWRSRGNGALRAESVISWAQILIDAVRAGGGTQPVSIGEGAWGVEINGTDNGFRVRDIASIVDFLWVHTSTAWRRTSCASTSAQPSSVSCSTLGDSPW